MIWWIVLPDERNRPKTPERSSLPILCNGNQRAQNQGYQYGLQTGASDAQRGQNYSPQRSHYYQQASSQAFRNGFVRGYNQGYRQYSGYGNGNYGGGRRGGSILGTIFYRP